jgi:2'-5' RNA ligase
MELMKKIGIFIEPTGSLAETIRNLKSEVELKLPGQKFCSHPLHSTLIYGRYREPSLWHACLAKVLFEQSAFRIQTRDFGVFYNDSQADGGHTFVLKVNPTPDIFMLQKSCADVLKKWRILDNKALDETSIESEPFRSSLVEYGFPFVGQFWIPHFTIASLKVPKDSPLLREISSGESRHEYMLDRVSIWEIEGDWHRKMFELQLGRSNAIRK